MSETKATDGWPVGGILRDIARGGLAGLLAGIVVAGIGGRIVMRAAALIVPAAAGEPTENGNRIGDITLGGSVGLIVVVGLLLGIAFGVAWVVISPWLPDRAVVRGLVAAPVAVGLGSFALIDRFNPDFAVLGHDAVVVAVLVGLVASAAPALVFFDGWLDRRLPRPASSRSTSAAVYAVVAVIGVALGSLLTMQQVFRSDSQPLGFTIIGMAIVTLAWWVRRVRGSDRKPGSLRLIAAGILLVGTVAGYSYVIRDVAGAAGLT